MTKYVANVLKPIYSDVEKFKSKDGLNYLLTISDLNSSYHEVYETLRHLKAEDSNEEKMSCGLIKAWFDWNYTNNPGSFIDYRECQNSITLNLSFEY